MPGLCVLNPDEEITLQQKSNGAMKGEMQQRPMVSHPLHSLLSVLIH